MLHMILLIYAMQKAVYKSVFIPAFTQAIYVDYSVNNQILDRFIGSIARRYGSSGIIRQELLPGDFNKKLDDFFPSNDDPFYKAQTANNWSEFHRFDPRNEKDYFFGCRIIFNSIGFNLTYLRTEAIQTFRILQSMKANPNILTFHDLFGGAWTNFGGESLLYKAAKVKPSYIYSGDNSDPWPKYRLIAKSREHNNGQSIGRSLYKRNS